ncbi:MAG: hypothetical protein ACRC33_31585 [Gemmataceae bacterium]
MGAILMALALGAVPGDDPLVAEEASAVRKELIEVRAELRRLVAREEAIKARLAIGAADAEARERLMKDSTYLSHVTAVQTAEAKFNDLKRMVTPDRVAEMTRGATERIAALKAKRDAYAAEDQRSALAGRFAEQRVYLTALERLLVADLKRLSGR